MRELRRRLGWRQTDLAERAGISQQTVSEIERGHIRDKAVGTIRAAAAALDARAEFQLVWRAGAADRLLDRVHAALVERVITILPALGWEVLSEVSFSHYGERGYIDVLAWKADLRAVVISEIKSDVTSVEETNRRLDVKERIAPVVVRERLGWSPSVVGVLLVLPDESTPRRHVARHRLTFTTRYPNTGKSPRGWLRKPVGRFAAVWFLALTAPTSVRERTGGRERIRKPKCLSEPVPRQ